MKTISKKTCLFLVNILVLFNVFLSNNILKAQVSINTDNTPPHNSAMLDISSTDKGVLIPRLTYAEKIAISNPAPGLLVFQTDERAGFYYYNEGRWAIVGHNSNPPGSIIMYSGVWSFNSSGLGTGELEGWALCNGNNDTPNLEDRFVMGTTIESDINQIGGNNSLNLTNSNLPEHFHDFATNNAGNHTHSIIVNSGGNHRHYFATYSAGSHSHTYQGSGNYHSWCSGGGGLYCNGGTVRYYPNHNSSTFPTWSTSSSGSHTHNGYTDYDGIHSHSASASTVEAHFHSGTTNSTGLGTDFDNRPAFIKLAFIMKL